MITNYQISKRKACSAIGLPRGTYGYKASTKHDDKYISLLNELVNKHVSIGFWQSYYRFLEENQTS